MIKITTLGHEFSAALSDAYKGVKVLESVAAKVAGDTVAQSAIEAVTAATFGTSAVDLERAVFAIAGELAAALQANDSAVTAKLVDAGLDTTVISDFKTLISSVKSLPTVAKK